MINKTNHKLITYCHSILIVRLILNIFHQQPSFLTESITSHFIFHLSSATFKLFPNDFTYHLKHLSGIPNKLVPYAGADKPFWPSSFSSLQRAKFVITVKYRIECPFCLVRFVSVFVFSSLSFSVFFLTREYSSIRFDSFCF